MWKTIVLVVVFMFSPGGGIFHSLYKNVRVSVPHKGNVGEPLFLTPYIEAGKLEEAKKQSLVPPFPGSNVKSYAGYITVNKTYNSNIFFWFFPAQVQPMAAPVVLWLQGGPGGSSMFGLFVEHGPYIVTSNMTEVGTGFSFTDDPQGYAVNEDEALEEETLRMVGTGFSFTDDPQGYAVNEDDVARNLYRIIGGYATFLYQIGLLDEKQRKYFQKQCDDCVKYIREERWFQAFEEPEDQNYYGKFLSLPQVRQAIHVGNRTFSDGSQVEKYMREDTVKSVKLWLAEIMDNYKVLIYNGQLDIIVAASLTERSLMAMKWKGSQRYKQAERKVWKIFKSDNEVAGYVRQVDDFCQVIVRGGGHILPYDQPLRSFDMINRFVFERGWDPY
ncbi:probable serine carboxypeptidase CPVL isoform X1 [Prionailurus iriomotensis]